MFTSRCTRWISHPWCRRVEKSGSGRSRSAGLGSRSRSSSARSPAGRASSPSGCCSPPRWGSWSSSAGPPAPSGSAPTRQPWWGTVNCASPNWPSGRGDRAEERSGCRAGAPGGTWRPTPCPPGCWSAQTRCRSRGRTRTRPQSPGTEGWSAGLGQQAYSPAQDSLLAAAGGSLMLTCRSPHVSYCQRIADETWTIWW